MKRLLWFTAGVVVGVVGISFWELFGKPVLPKPEIDDEDYESLLDVAEMADVLWKAHTSSLGEALKVLYPPDGIKPEPKPIDTLMPHRHEHQGDKKSYSLADIQKTWFPRRTLREFMDGKSAFPDGLPAYNRQADEFNEPEPFPFVDMDVSEMSMVELKAYLEMKAKEDTQPVKVV